MTQKKEGPITSEAITIDIQAFLTPLAIIVGSIIVSIAILLGFNSIKGNVSTNSNNSATTTTTTPAPTTGEEFPTASTNIDNDAYKGDKSKAKIAIVEFSDYECPFCKRHYQQTYPQIIKEYVDTGKAILVFRDFPLYFHDPVATWLALGAECAKEQGGNNAYFAFHDKLFGATGSNGIGIDNRLNGISDTSNTENDKNQEIDKMGQFANEIGINGEQLKECVRSEKYADEIKKDLSDGQSAGVSGTPGFVIGVLKEDGTVEGRRIDGAYPYDSFKQIIEEYL